ncbi:MAG: metalloregulator ArsR/SmtB family transcription factor [Eubacteriales bacterium]|nr:metalloregulator ArsR/SmtB family transcription factor [Eubacteriales bacterium]
MGHDHNERLEKVRSGLPSDESLCDLADLFKIFGDTTRMKILYALSETELCVCAIAELLGMTQPAISHQLKILRNAHLVGSRREGRTVYCFLADEHVETIVSQGFEHLMERETEKERRK